MMRFGRVAKRKCHKKLRSRHHKIREEMRTDEPMDVDLQLEDTASSIRQWSIEWSIERQIE